MDQFVANLKNELDHLEITADAFCTLAEISGAKWSRALRGTIVLPGDELLRLAEVVRSLREISEDALPFVINFRDLTSVRHLLKHKENQVICVLLPTNLDSQGLVF
jgi:hypothetical protein